MISKKTANLARKTLGNTAIPEVQPAWNVEFDANHARLDSAFQPSPAVPVSAPHARPRFPVVAAMGRSGRMVGAAALPEAPGMEAGFAGRGPPVGGLCGTPFPISRAF